MTRAQDESRFSSINIVCTRVNLSVDLIICKTIHLSGKEQTEMQLHLSNQGWNAPIVWLWIQEHPGRKINYIGFVGKTTVYFILSVNLFCKYTWLISVKLTIMYVLNTHTHTHTHTHGRPETGIPCVIPLYPLNWQESHRMTSMLITIRETFIEQSLVARHYA